MSSVGAMGSAIGLYHPARENSRGNVGVCRLVHTIYGQISVIPLRPLKLFPRRTKVVSG